MEIKIGSKVRLFNSNLQAIRLNYVICGKEIVDGSVATCIGFDMFFM